MTWTVAVSQRVDCWVDRGERRDALDQRLHQWLWAAGCLPVPVPNILALPDEQASHGLGLWRWLEAVNPDAVLLSGGNDVGEMPERDRTEEGLLTFARQRVLPVLGICRGMQQLAVWAGARLEPVAGHVRVRHRLQAVGASGAWPGEVNSFHNLTLGGCPAGYVVTARAGDDSIEAICHQVLPWEGWMWHPEREWPFDNSDVSRWRALLVAGRRE
ncbi:MAG: gamma-glutamyl-gamma-aminobutyrate hydrolase family protein [Magnetococcus sp. DMHC-8]